MNAQDIFNRVWNHFIVEGNPRSIKHRGPDGGTICAYRGNSGAKCAAGLFILDEHYSSKIEGCTIKESDSLPSIALQKSGFPDEHRELLVKLQKIHDTNFHIEDMERFLRKLALNMGLSVQPSTF